MGTRKQTPTGNASAKRPRSDSQDSDSENEMIVDHGWPRFLVIEGTDEEQPISKLSPFAIAKGLEGLAGTPKDVKKLRNGQILVEVDRKAHSDNLLKSKLLANCPIHVSAHNSLNLCKGIMRCPDLRDCSPGEILEGLRSQLVTEVKRIYVTRDGEKKPTNTFVITFNRPRVPSAIKVGYLNVPVEVYVPNPLRCFKCQQFGHHKDKCRRDPVCAKCGKKDHEEASCDQPVHCVNCKGSHAAFSKDCPKWHEEKEVQRLKHTQGLSYPVARKLVQQPVQKSYVSVVANRPSVASVSVQTDLSWHHGKSDWVQTQKAAPTRNQANAGSQTSQNVSNKKHKDNQKEKQPNSESRSRSVSKEPPKQRPRPSTSSESAHSNNRFSCLDVDDEEESMDTGTVSKDTENVSVDKERASKPNEKNLKDKPAPMSVKLKRGKSSS